MLKFQYSTYNLFQLTQENPFCNLLIAQVHIAMTWHVKSDISCSHKLTSITLYLYYVLDSHYS